MLRFLLRAFARPLYASRVAALAVLLGLCCAAFWPRNSDAKFQSRTQPTANWTTTQSGVAVFIIYPNEKGETTCREATKTERDFVNSRSRGGPTRIIYPGASRSSNDELRALSDSTGLNLSPSAG